METTGDIFAAPPNSVLIRMYLVVLRLSVIGVWGSGVALEFKKRYPQAFEAYHEECNTPSTEFHQKSLLGTALLIPPQKDDLTSTADEGHWIACLFTSVDYGKKVSSALVILESTKKAMADLQRKMKFRKAQDQKIGDMWAVKINSGKFGVPWDRTKRILEQCGMDIKVVVPGAEVVGAANEVEQSGKGTSKTAKSAAVAGKASLLDAPSGGSVMEEDSKCTVKISKKRKERKESSSLHEPQLSKKVSQDRIKSSKRRKGKKHGASKNESHS
ncbi:ADP-ribose 1''-phosphate phosphatase [Xylographa opegraphella]|nr:ADP-ribose 1''-phosphate phosphatase [Xylographa opegraphella]